MTEHFIQSSGVDSKNLRKMLNEISDQLSITYVKKRALSNSHKQSIKDELQDAISYLSDKERELQVSLDIAKYLLDCNEDLQSRIVKLKDTEKLMQSEHKQLLNEIKNYQELLREKDEKYENTTEILTKTETQLLRLSVERERESNYRKNSFDSLIGSDSGDRSYSDFNGVLQAELEKQQSNLYSESFVELERKYSRLFNEKEKIDKLLTATKDQYDSLCSKHKKTVDKLKDLQKTQKIVIESNEKLQKKLAQVKFNNEKLVEKLEKLEEDIKIAENSQKTKTSESNQNSSSLLAELQMLQDPEDSVKITDESEDDFFSPKVGRFQERRFSYTPNAKIMHAGFDLITQQVSTLGVPSKIKETRKDPDEEYFILATLAVKTNSPHMDTICVIPHSVLYDKAKRDGIPFHQWHLWIEKQLNFEYIQTLYRTRNKMQRFKNFLKKF